VTLGVGYMVASRGVRNLRNTNVFPTQTLQSIKETTWTNKTPA